MEQRRPFILTEPLNERDDDCACPEKALVLSFNGEPDKTDSTDCACPDNGLALRSPKQKGRLFSQTPDVHTQRLPGDYLLAFSPYAPAGPSVLNPPAWARWQVFQSPQPLAELVDHDLHAQMLIYPAGRLPIKSKVAPYTLTAWMHITNACNLDCPYCYVRKSSDWMSAEVGERAVVAIFQTAEMNGFRRVKLKYAGGEASLHFDLIRRLHTLARRLAQQRGLELREVVLSNGYHLKPADAEWLAVEGVKLMISVDGVGEVHDRLRPRKDGRGTFSQVERTVDEVLLARGVRPDISMTVTRLNALAAPQVARWAMIERGLPLSFNFYRQNLLSADRRDLDLEEQAIVQGLLEAYALIETHVPTQPFFNGLLDRVQGEAHSHTCGVGNSYLVITHTGQLAQCQMHLQNPVSPILEGDLLLLAAAGPINNLPVDEKEGCRSCSYRYRCSGGCPLETYRATGRWDVRSPNCNIYKSLLPAALRLEGLRLMKVNGLLS